MTQLLEHAVDVVRGLPPETQDDLARVLLQLAGEQPVIQLTAEEEASFEESLEQAERGEFATDEQVRAIWVCMVFELRYTPRGAAELDKVLTDLAQRSPQGGRHVQMRIQEIITLLLRHPYLGDAQ